MSLYCRLFIKRTNGTRPICNHAGQIVAESGALSNLRYAPNHHGAGDLREWKEGAGRPAHALLAFLRIRHPDPEKARDSAEAMESISLAPPERLNTQFSSAPDKAAVTAAVCIRQ